MAIAGFTERRSQGYKFAFASRGWPDRQVEEVAKAIANGLHGHGPMLKVARRRRIFRIALSGTPASLVVKAFPLNLMARFRYRKYAVAELANYRVARDREIPVPEYHAYFERRSLGLVALTGLLIEDLAGWATLGDLLAEEMPAGVRRLVVAVVARMFDAGVNHADTTPDNFLLSPDHASIKLIDWQYASFHRPRQSSQLVLQSARLLQYAEVAGDDAARWLADLHAACQPDISLDEFRRSVEAAMRIKQPIGRRLALRISTR